MKTPLLQHIAFVILYSIPACCMLCMSCKKSMPLVTTELAANTRQEDLATVAQPNIIIFLVDEMGYEIPTANGGQSYTTPFIDSMAFAGKRFTQCYGSADCSPSRFMLLTGKYNFRNYTQWGVMNPSEKTIGNMFKDNGYATCYAGKWQLDGEDNSIRGFGFDHYSVWEAFATRIDAESGPRYKSPYIYQDGAYLPDSVTKNKYSPDIYTEYISRFIDTNKKKPFFICYSIPLVHKPFGPTPDDAEYNSWDFSKSDERFFPSMVEYMDKQLGILASKIKASNLQQKTIFIIMGDNGTPSSIISLFNGIAVTGDKGKTTTYGTHAPLVFCGTKYIKPGTVSKQLVDFTDFLPTLAGLSSIPVPGTYGILDGVSFSDVIKGTVKNTQKDYVFNHFEPLINPGSSRLFRYASNATYKLYDDNRFYNMHTDIQELLPLPDSGLTTKEIATKNYLQEIIDRMHN